MEPEILPVPPAPPSRMDIVLTGSTVAVNSAAATPAIAELADPSGRTLNSINEAADKLAAIDTNHLVAHIGTLIEHYPVPSAIFFGVGAVLQGVKMGVQIVQRNRAEHLPGRHRAGNQRQVGTV